MNFPSLLSITQRPWLTVSHFFQEQEDSRCCIGQKPGEESNLMRTFCVQAWTTLGNAVNFRKI